jgi:hypothetical protein
MYRFALFVAITFYHVPACLTAVIASSNPRVGAGPSTDGLRIAISATSATVPSSRAEFLISIQNIGKTDFVVNLGFMLANGKVMFPEAVRLSLTDRGGDTRDLRFFDRQPASVSPGQIIVAPPRPPVSTSA